jgi:amino-acid N-acetyltransferase
MKAEMDMQKIEGEVRPARMQDADAIHDLVSYYAERHRMLFRTLEDIYERLREFRVFVDSEGKILGCAGLAFLWRDLAEIRSMAVDPNFKGCGIGRRLVEDAVEEARRLGLKRVFALTYEDKFFERLQFKVVDKETLPHKVWTDCIRCPMRENCNEVPMVMELE